MRANQATLAIAVLAGFCLDPPVALAQSPGGDAGGALEAITVPVPRAASGTGPSRSAAPAPTDAATNREVQAALNALGYDAGPADGILGRRSRAAIAAFQARHGFPATGTLLVGEYRFLLDSRDRGSGPPPAAPDPGAAALPMPRLPGVPLADPIAVELAMAIRPRGGLDALTGDGVPVLSALCAEADARLQAAAAPSGVASGAGTAGQAVLDSAFCEVRAAVLTRRAELLAQRPDLTADDVWRACQGVAQTLDRPLDDLAARPAAELRQDLTALVALSGTDPGSLDLTGTLCLGEALVRDAERDALAAALMLAGTGRDGIGEVVGYHLLTGRGTAASRTGASDWYDLAAGAEPMVPGANAAARAALLRAALDTVPAATPAATGLLPLPRMDTNALDGAPGND